MFWITYSCMEIHILYLLSYLENAEKIIEYNTLMMMMYLPWSSLEPHNTIDNRDKGYGDKCMIDLDF